MSETTQPSPRPVKASGNPNSSFLGPQTRATFLDRAGTILAGALSAAAGASAAARASGADASEETSGRQGKQGSRIKRWDVVTIGNLSRNHYWGESEAKPVRSVICTCTLIVTDGARILVDPSLTDAQQMKKELDRRAGLELDEIDAVFITHEHGDHYAGAAHFPDARWLASPEVAKILNERRRLPKRVEPVTGRLFEAVDVTPTPGHDNYFLSGRLPSQL